MSSSPQELEVDLEDDVPGRQFAEIEMVLKAPVHVNERTGHGFYTISDNPDSPSLGGRVVCDKGGVIGP
jgi:hypothetical protein